MAKKSSKGGKRGRRGKNNNQPFRRELIFKEPGHEYAQVLKMLGDGRVNAYCFDGQQRICHIRGAMRKRVWIRVSDIILISLRDYQPDKADIIHKYLPEEVRSLQSYAEIPKNINLGEDRTVDQTEDELPFEFTDDISQSDSEDQLESQSEDQSEVSEEVNLDDL